MVKKKKKLWIYIQNYFIKEREIEKLFKEEINFKNYVLKETIFHI